MYSTEGAKMVGLVDMYIVEPGIESGLVHNAQENRRSVKSYHYSGNCREDESRYIRTKLNFQK
jgi:hypothetical protein